MRLIAAALLTLALSGCACELEREWLGVEAEFMHTALGELHWRREAMNDRTPDQVLIDAHWEAEWERHLGEGHEPLEE